MQNALLNFTMLAFLFLIFASMYRGRPDRRLKLWLAGWFLLLINGALAMARGLPAAVLLGIRIVHLQMLILACIFFLLSFAKGVRTARESFWLGASLAVPNFIGVVLVYMNPSPVRWIVGIILVGEAICLWQSGRLQAGRRRRLVQAILVVSGLAMLACARYLVTSVPGMATMQLLLVDAVLLWYGGHRRDAGTGRRTTGVYAATAGLLLWASVFPIAALFGQFIPDLLLSAMYWNFPKFFAAFGMILMLNEEVIGRATELSEKYRLLFDHHPLPMWVFHRQTLRFLAVNEAAVASYGYTREQFAAMTIEDIRPPESLPRLRRVLDTSDDALHQTTSWRHTLRDGSTIDVDIFSHSISFEEQPARIVVAMNVTKRNAAEGQLRQAYKLESLGQLTGGVAHDFNNILAIILGNLELVEQRKMLDESGQIAVRHAISSVHRGADVTRRLLAYARQQPLSPRIVAIDRLLEDTVGFVRSSLGPAVAVEVQTEPHLWNAQIDPGQLENALLNLAINARDAMEENGRIRIECRNLSLTEAPKDMQGEMAVGDYVVISVEDNGCGMPEDVVARATEPFFTTKPVGKGTGLGLSMVYGFMKQSGGHMQIESSLHRGTTVTLYLPRAAQATVPAGLVLKGGERRKMPRGGEQILVVEDEHAIRQVLVQLLRSLGYTVLEAEDGPMALRHLEQTPGIDLLLTDVVLPNGISGGHLAADAKVLQPPIKVLFSSGYTRNVLIRERRLEEGVHLLTKPFRLAELAATVRYVLDLEEV